jgi:hypothetical protein
MSPSLQAPGQDLEGGSDSARVGADPVHWGNQRLQTLEDTREDRALPNTWVGFGLIKAPAFM